jgi:PD-(D/E)XK nuclease superfamily
MTADLPIVRTSERSALGRCPQQWWWKYRMGLVPKDEVSDALWLGLGVHEALAQWYQPGKKRGRHPADFFEEWSGDELRYISASREDWDALPKYEDAAQLGISMMDEYVKRYGKDPSWHVIATEKPFEVTIKRGGQALALFGSRWDGVYRDLEDNTIKLMEHKTAKQIQTAYLEMDDQAGAYWAVANAVLLAEGVLKAGERISEITYNFLRKAMPDDRPRNKGGAYLNKDLSVSKQQPAPYFVRHPVERSPGEVRSQFERLGDQVAVMNAMRAGVIPVTKTITKDCPWCPFWDMCKLHEQDNDNWVELMTGLYDQVDPYLQNRKSA